MILRLYWLKAAAFDGKMTQELLERVLSSSGIRQLESLDRAAESIVGRASLVYLWDLVTVIAASR